MSFYGSLVLIERSHLAYAKVEGSFEAYASYLDEAYDRGTKTTLLVMTKLGSECLSVGQEDIEIGSLKEYVVVLSFELLRKKQCVAKIVER